MRCRGGWLADIADCGRFAKAGHGHGHAPAFLSSSVSRGTALLSFWCGISPGCVRATIKNEFFLASTSTPQLAIRIIEARSYYETNSAVYCHKLVENPLQSSATAPLLG